MKKSKVRQGTRPRHLAVWPFLAPRNGTVLLGECLESRIQLTATISGVVYLDHDGDGVRDTNEAGVPGSLVTLRGTLTPTGTIERTALTRDDGSYRFEGLDAGTYSLTQTQPAALTEGDSDTDVANATASGSQISQLVVAGDENFAANNFGESTIKPEFVSLVWFFASTASTTTSTSELFREVMAIGEENAGNFLLADSIRAGDPDGPADSNSAPVANPDEFSIEQGNSLIVAVSQGVLDNDVDADGDSLTASLVSTSTNGTLSLLADGSFDYTPEATFSGTDSFTYSVSDGTTSSNVATVTITVQPSVNLAPVAANDNFTIAEDQVLFVPVATSVLDNDSDSAGTTLTATLVTSPEHGQLTLAADGSFQYTPNSDFNGADSFTYTASDGQLNSNAAVVAVVVTPVNDPPVATSDTFEVDEDQQLVVTNAVGVLANDNDVDGDSLTVQVVTTTEHGTLVLNADGSLSYTPDENFSGSDSFSYQVADGAGGSQQATATIQVLPVNDIPIAVGDTFSTDEDSPLTVDAVFGLLANDTDVEGSVLSALLVDSPQQGTVIVAQDGSFTYTPNENFSGTDSFTYRALDGADESVPATVNINVQAVNDPGTITLPAEFSDSQTPVTRILGELIFFRVSVADPDDTDYVFQLDLEASGIPEDAATPAIDSATGQFTWTPTAMGTFELRVITVNGRGDANQETFLIEVVDDTPTNGAN